MAILNLDSLQLWLSKLYKTEEKTPTINDWDDSFSDVTPTDFYQSNSLAITEPYLQQKLMYSLNRMGTDTLSEQDAENSFDYIQYGPDNLDPSQIESMTYFLETITRNDWPSKLNLTTADLKQIETYKRNLPKPSEFDESLLKDIRDVAIQNSDLSLTEIAFRKKAYLVDPDSSAIQTIVDSLFKNGTLSESASIKDIANAIGTYVQTTYDYRPDSNGEDVWNDVQTTINAGEGDCEDLTILIASLLMNALKHKGYSDSEVRTLVTVSAGKLTVDGGEVGHTFVKFADSLGQPANWALDATSKSEAVSFSSLNFHEVFAFNDRVWTTVDTIDQDFQTAYEIKDLDLFLAELESSYDDLYYQASKPLIEVWSYDYDSFVSDRDTAIRLYTQTELYDLASENGGSLPSGIHTRSLEDYRKEGDLTVSRSVYTPYTKVGERWVKSDPIMDYFWTVETHELQFNTDDVDTPDTVSTGSVVTIEAGDSSGSVSGAGQEIAVTTTLAEELKPSSFSGLYHTAPDIWANLIDLGYIDAVGNVIASKIDMPINADDFIPLDFGSPLFIASQFDGLGAKGGTDIFNELKLMGVLDSNGKITSIFNPSSFSMSNTFSSYTDDVKNILDFRLTSDDLKTLAQSVNQTGSSLFTSLENEGYIDSYGHITDRLNPLGSILLPPPFSGLANAVQDVLFATAQPSTDNILASLLLSKILDDNQFIQSGLSGSTLTAALTASIYGTPYEGYESALSDLLNAKNGSNPLADLGDTYSTLITNSDGISQEERNAILDILRDHLPLTDSDGIPVAP
ncbi:hypothetical protein HOH45_09680, partial [bacterium]|nr:hypothetical protein [bacterium]